MTIGSSIVLIVIGAILAFAVEFDIAGIDIKVIGYILMLGGLIGLIIGFAMMNRRRTYTTETPVAPVREREIVRDRDVY